MKYLLATFNPSKLKEIKSILPESIEIVCLGDIPGAEEPEENGDTLEANAQIKAEYGYRLTGLPTLSDDTGLLVEALNGQPGVYSARYAGEPSNSERNMQKLLEALQGIDNRTAEFRTVIALMQNDGNLIYFTGVLPGKIANAPEGTNGFGYDPIFIPEGEARTLGSFSSEEKNRISHRARALKKLSDYLQGNSGVNP